MVRYEIDYFLPNALAQVINPVAIDSPDGSYSVQQLVKRAPTGAYGFNVFKGSGPDRQLIKSYYINAQLLDHWAVAQHYGRRSHAYSALLTSGCQYMIRLFNGLLLPFNPDHMELAYR